MNHRKFFLGLVFSLCWSVVFSQFKVTFLLRKVPAYHKSSESVYLAGSFNSWNPKDQKMRLTETNGKTGITIELPRGMTEYKFTKGGWDNVESGEEAFPTTNRRLNVEKDTTVLVDIHHWADHFPRKPKQTTANSNVHILDSAFFIPQLNRHRRIWIYLPESYHQTKKKYPVLYMHDGQNVFDNATSYSGEWGVDEALDSLGKTHGESIVVAVDNGSEKRMNEYSPFDMERFGKGEGDAYVDFLVQTLMPYINTHYRTKKSGKYNVIAGSSMGGLISLYAILKYPRKFGGAGVFSPAFWIAPKIREYAEARAKKVKGKIYFFAGQKESDSMVPDMLSVFELMRKNSKAEMEAVIRAEGTHNEGTWKEEFPQFYKWIM